MQSLRLVLRLVLGCRCSKHSIRHEIFDPSKVYIVVMSDENAVKNEAHKETIDHLIARNTQNQIKLSELTRVYARAACRELDENGLDEF